MRAAFQSVERRKFHGFQNVKFEIQKTLKKDVFCFPREKKVPKCKIILPGKKKVPNCKIILPGKKKVPKCKIILPGKRKFQNVNFFPGKSSKM